MPNRKPNLGTSPGRAALGLLSAAGLLTAVGMLSALGCASAEAASKTPGGGTLEGRWKARPDDAASRPVTFSFHREERGEGRISVRLGESGSLYAGNYLRLTGKRPLARLRVFYTSWVSDPFDAFSRGPSGAPLNRGTLSIEEFQRRYSGSVVATLIREGGGSMRCVFTLNDPDGGLAAGAGGNCQASDGGVIQILSSKSG